VVLHEGDELRYHTPGGAGFGDPHERERELVFEDVREGWITEEAARRDYAFDGDGA
jgi:N-methylhydantoinase B/oxoprolinase/acetone carboxylase alpha subunit